MKRRTFLQATLGLGAAVTAHGVSAVTQTNALASDANGALVWQQRPLLGFGSSLSLQVAHPDKAWGQLALDTAVADIRHVEAQMSLFNPNSALSQLNGQGFLAQPHPDLLRILMLSKAISEKSQGTFDVTVQPLWTAFSKAHRAGLLPTPEAVAAARRHTGWQYVELSPKHIRFARPHMAITLNGIAQGFAADLVKAHWRAMGIEHALINTGEWASLGKPQSPGDWHLGIADPREAQKMIRRIALNGRCVASSSDSQTYFSPDLANHHIFNPRTGYSPTEVASVTVAADNCTLADALTKVMFVAGLAPAMALAKEWSVDVLVVDKAGKWRATPGFDV